MNFENAFIGPQSIQVCHLRSKTHMTSVDRLRGPPRPIHVAAGRHACSALPLSLFLSLSPFSPCTAPPPPISRRRRPLSPPCAAGEASRGGGAGAPARRGWRRRGPPARRPGDHVLLYLAGAELRRASKAMADLRAAELGRPWRISALSDPAPPLWPACFGGGGPTRGRSERRSGPGRRSVGRGEATSQAAAGSSDILVLAGGGPPRVRPRLLSSTAAVAPRAGRRWPLPLPPGGGAAPATLPSPARRVLAAATGPRGSAAVAAPPPSPACGAACLRAAARPSSSSRAPLEVAAARCLLTAGFPCSLHRRAASPCPLHPPLARLGGRGEARQSGRGGRASLPCFSSPVAAERGGAAAERGERAEHGRGARRPTRGRWQARGQGAASGRGRRAGPARRGAVGSERAAVAGLRTREPARHAWRPAATLDRTWRST